MGGHNQEVGKLSPWSECLTVPHAAQKAISVKPKATKCNWFLSWEPKDKRSVYNPMCSNGPCKCLTLVKLKRNNVVQNAN